MSDIDMSKYQCPDGLREDWWGMLIEELQMRGAQTERSGERWAAVHLSPDEARYVLKCLEARPAPEPDLSKVVAAVYTYDESPCWHMFADQAQAERFARESKRVTAGVSSISVAYHPPEPAPPTWPIERTVEIEGDDEIRVVVSECGGIGLDDRVSERLDFDAPDWPAVRAAVDDALAEYERRKGEAH